LVTGEWKKARMIAGNHQRGDLRVAPYRSPPNNRTNPINFANPPLVPWISMVCLDPNLSAIPVIVRVARPDPVRLPGVDFCFADGS